MTMGLPVNIYFMAHSIIDYNQALVKFLGTSEGRYYWAKLESVNQSKQGLYLSALFLPVGLSASEYRKLLNIVTSGT
jgi:hypothetical protein